MTAKQDPPVWGEPTTLAEFGPKSAMWRVTSQTKDGVPAFSLRRWYVGRDGITRPARGDGLYLGDLARFQDFAAIMNAALEVAQPKE